MKRKGLLLGGGLGLALAMTISLAGWVGVNAQDCRLKEDILYGEQEKTNGWVVVNALECRVIRIHGMIRDDIIALEPETMRISRATCVIWFNRAVATNVKVVFEEGKKCADATYAHGEFHIDDYDSCYVNNWVSFAGTSSLTFKEKGTYKYIIETAEAESESLPERGKKLAQGSIMVSE